MKRWQLICAGIGAVALVVSGIVIGQLWALRAHADNDHIQHHVVILVINELIRRDPSLAAFVDAALGAPDILTAPVVEEPPPAEESPVSP